MSKKFKLISAGNTEPPLYSLLLEKGYEVKLHGEDWVAENDVSIFAADNVLELAGLIMLYENKGKNWRVEDNVVEEFVEKFGS